MASSRAESTLTERRNSRWLACNATILSLIVLMPGAGKGGEAMMDAKTLGVTESILSYCARVDSGSVPRLRDKLKTMVQGASAAALTQTRKSAEYRAAYASVTDFVAKIDPHNAKRPCGEALADRAAGKR
jgi:hypothetical protein